MLHPSSFFLWISSPGRGRKGPNDGDKRFNNRSKLYRDKLWALDWVGGTNEPGCGAAVFLTEDEGATWYCCRGIIRSEIDKATAEKGKVDERDLRKFFLTSVYVEQGTDWVKTDHKVSLDLALFKEYGQKAFVMKAFGGKGDGNEFRMLLPVEFLNKTNGYRKSGQFPTVGAGHQLTMPLVPFDTPVESLAGFSTFSSDRRQVVSTPQQPVGKKQKLITYSRRSGGGSSTTTPKTMELARCLSDLPESSRAAASSRLRNTPQHQMDEESDEETEEDERVCKLDSRFLATPGHIRGEGSCDVNVGREAGGGGKARVAVTGGVEYGGQGGSEMEDGELENNGGDAGVSAGLTSKRGGKRTAEESQMQAAPKKQARRKAVDEAQNALDASQGTLGEPDVKHKSSARIHKTSQPKNLVRPSRRQKLDDSSDDAEGVAPCLLSLPDDIEHETKKPSAINMTQCYFLEYDEEGKTRRDPLRVVIDVVQILRILEGDIAFNQRSLNMAILAGLDAAIELSTGPRAEDDPPPWEPPELVLAPITPWKDDPDRQGIRVLPKDFGPDRADEYFYYPVAGQHTAEAMKRAVARESAAVDMFGFRNYDRVRIIYFNDDHTNGYVYVSTYDNTRGNRAMLSLFHQACQDIRNFWDSKNQIGPVRNVSKTDPIGLTQQEEWRKFMRICMGRSCDKSLWTEALAPKWQQDWTNRMRGYMNVATCRDRIRPLVKDFFEKFEAGELPLHDNQCPKDSSGRQERRMPGQFVQEVQGKKEVFHCIPAKDGGPNATVSLKDLVPSNFKCFGDMAAREKEIALFGIKAGEWDEERDRIPLEYVRRVPKRLGGEQEQKDLKGAGLKATEALYRDAPFHFKYFVYHAIGKVDLLTAELRRLKNVALHLCWEKKGRRSTLLSVNMHPKELLLAADEIVTAVTNLNCKASILDLANPKECLAWSPTDFDALHIMMSKLLQERPSSGGNADHDMLTDADEDDLAVPDPSPKLMPSDDIPDRIVQDSAQQYFIHDKVPETTSKKWGHRILWHTDVFEPCVFKGEWMMALHLSSGWKIKPRLAEEPWLKVARSEIVFRVKCENEGVDEAAIEEKARLLFDSLRSDNRLEYKHKFYDLPSSRSYKTIDWKMELPPACQGIETIRLGCSQLGEQSTTQFAASVGEAMSQTAVKMMGVDKGTRNVNEDKSNVGSYEPPLITQAGNQSESQMESPTPSANMAVADGMQQGGHAERASEVQENSDEMMKVLTRRMRGRGSLGDQPRHRL
ncbi:hypothetical protein CBR_g26248 [Chara braunii]|uniref:Uncharacterized protein n=1 Tax=Chara braunii TaxID=69332 RepID=A0A388L7D9_CHABU|nr:hypothetical protein CBR_g26248 [Chara braunii]|eukprot:GBG78215.1 hypothetical protein CBR_g26248 [Chara braunii]